MTPTWRCWCWKLGFWLAMGGALARVVVLSPIAISGDCVLAQITPDATLGASGSVVTPTSIDNLPARRIDGGAIRGANLFHSFQEFNVGEGREAYFTNPDAIANILSRVTGGNPSNILSRLGVLGNASLFLINPNGIIFRPNARLDVKGSFVATTASAIGFENQGFFSASAPNKTGLLAANSFTSLFNQIMPETIVQIPPSNNRLHLISLTCYSTATGGTSYDQISLYVNNTLVWGPSSMNAGNEANLTAVAETLFHRKVLVEIFDQSRLLGSAEISATGGAPLQFINGSANYTLTYQVGSNS